MNKTVLRRYLILVVGFLFMGIGIAFTKQSDLGVSPITSVSNVLYIIFPKLSFGTWVFIWNLALVFIQILILRRDFKPIEFIQLPLSLLLGVCTDLGMVAAGRFPVVNYGHRLMAVGIGIAILSLGISLTLSSELFLSPGESTIKVIADKIGKPFGSVKTVFDTSCVILAVGISFAVLGTVEGIREGTLITALFTGSLVRLVNEATSGEVKRFIKG